MAKSIKLHNPTKLSLDNLEVDWVFVKSYDQKIAYLQWFHKTYIDQLNNIEVIANYYQHLKKQKD